VDPSVEGEGSDLSAEVGARVREGVDVEDQGPVVDQLFGV
jgi:hypothetical protein